MSKIKNLTARKILNSRGDWTTEATVFLESGVEATASVPEGKSKGTFEAVAVSTEASIKNIQSEILETLKGVEVSDQADIDGKLCELDLLDGTPNKEGLGANSTLAVSVACARAGAKEKKVELYEHIAESFGFKPEMPRFFANLINGGLHAGSNLRFQEYMIIPKSCDAKEASELVRLIYESLGKELESKFGKHGTLIGDEGGYAPDFNEDAEPFALLSEVLERNNLRGEVDFGLDAAASGVKASPTELTEIYRKMITDFKLFYLEDPYGEEDFEHFSNLHKEFPETLIAGDDLTVTSAEKIKLAESRKSANAVIIKPNQRGTITEAVEAVKLAREYGWKVVASHRSGETDDDFIADFAVGVGADGLKLGAPARGERVAKYNRLLQISERL